MIPAGEVRFRFSRASGPGGQNVNKRSTKVELLFDVRGSAALSPTQRERILHKLSSRTDEDGILRIVADEARTQGRNREMAVERFRELLAEALKPPPPKRRKTRPSKASVNKRIESKKRRSDTKRTRSKVRPDPD